MTTEQKSQGKKARELNDTIRYTMWSVFSLRDLLGPDADRETEARELDEVVERLAHRGRVPPNDAEERRPLVRREPLELELATLLARYTELMHSNEPVHTWEVGRA